MDNIPTNDIKLAAILIAMGIPTRQSDPVTCVVTNEGGIRKETFTFWFDVSAGKKDEAKKLIDAYQKARNWEEMVLDAEHPLYWMKGALENREVLLHWIRKNVKPMKIIQHGNKTVLIGENASKSLKDKIRKIL